MAICMLPVEQTSEELAREKGSDEDREGHEPPTESGKDPQRDDPGDGGVNGEKPGGGEPSRPRSPEPEGKVQEEYRSCDCPEVMHRQLPRI